MPSRQKPSKQASEKQARSTTVATYLQRKVETRNELPQFLIVCEGKKTEPNYFKALAAELRVNVSIRVEGLGDNTDSLVERAIELKGTDDYLQSWCVFDRDSFPAERFNRAIQRAKSQGFQVAYSNEAFELWYVLHFEYLQAGLPRDDYGRKLTRHLRKKYQKNSPTMHSQIRHRQETAIQNANRLLSTYDPHNPEQDNPATTVQILVQELNKFRRD